ncbi:hypothetical protein P7H15_03510 [Paenibacillus larvae]|nr:hypothetical protein [Paenibacillus larvae]MDT2264980.1 hypothetical protein [Paenibacillus larvae]MDT2292160.1 hypothetical protein [Paenibacillus larvae]
MTDAVHKAGFDFVQLHGDESPEFCCWVKENLNVGIFKAFCITPDIKKDHTESNSVVDNKWGPYSEAGVDAFLLDTLDPDQQGEQGKHFAGEASGLPGMVPPASCPAFCSGRFE